MHTDNTPLPALHSPVMLDEALEHLAVRPNSWYIDATFGRGGHTTALLASGARVIAFDWDHQAIEYGTATYKQAIESGKLVLVHDSFANMNTQVDRIMSAANQSTGDNNTIAGILFDFGTSSDQLLSSERGFSFQGDGPLDMRMDTRFAVQAKDILAAVPEKQLAELFANEGGERRAKAIARAIKSAPEPIVTTKQLRECILAVTPAREQHKSLHPATKVFQALRIAVNQELPAIADGLTQALELVGAGGSIVCISFHEGEDRIVKQTYKKWHEQELVMLSELIKPTEQEVQQNPRARSAKLRACTKQKNIKKV